MRLHKWLHQISDIFTKLECSIQWVPHLATQVVNELTKGVAKQSVSFVRDYMPP